MNQLSTSLQLATALIGKIVTVKIDRQLGTKHPKWGFEYNCNYGYIEGIKAPDGEDLDAYVLKVSAPVSVFTGKVVAVIHRLKDDDDKVVVIPESEEISDKEIEKAVEFQEKWFDHEIKR